MSLVIGFSMSSPAGLCLSFISRQGIEAAAGSQSLKRLGFFFFFFYEYGSKFQKFKRADGESLSPTLFPSFPPASTTQPPVLPVVCILPEILCEYSFPFFFFFFSFFNTNGRPLQELFCNLLLSLNYLGDCYRTMYKVYFAPGCTVFHGYVMIPIPC